MHGGLSQSSEFDPYYRWLGIPPAEQPPTHYRLLGLADFESDQDVIESAADRQMAHVRSHQAGSRSALSQRLLNELSAAKLCLLNAQAKAAYDASLWQLRSQAALQSHRATLPQRPPVVIAQAIALAPIAARMKEDPIPARQPKSIAAERLLADQRAKAAFYRKLRRAAATIVGVVPAVLLCAIAWQNYQLQRASVQKQSGQREQAATQAAGQQPPPPEATPASRADGPGTMAAIPVEPSQAPNRPAHSETASQPLRNAGESKASLPPLYPLSQAWFLDWNGATWETDVHERFTAKQAGHSYLIECEFAEVEGYEHKLIVFHQPDPLFARMTIKLAVENGQVQLGLRDKRLTTCGEQVQFDFVPGGEHEAELWIDDAGTTRATIDGKPASISSDPNCRGYFTLAVSRKCRLRIYNLHFNE